MTTAHIALFAIGFAIGILVGAVPVYAEWQVESRNRAAKHDRLVRLTARTESDNKELRASLEAARPTGLTPVYDGIVIDLFKRDLDSLDEARETWGGGPA